MDPEATLQEALAALVRNDWAAARDYLTYYRHWRKNGGFEPPGGDSLADAYESVLTGGIK